MGREEAEGMLALRVWGHRSPQCFKAGTFSKMRADISFIVFSKSSFIEVVEV